MDPALQPPDSKDILLQLLGNAKEQCRKDGVGFWTLSTSNDELEDMKEYGFEWRDKIEFGNISFYAMKYVGN